MRNEQQCLDGSELWNSLRWFFDREHDMSMIDFDPLNGTVINFVKGKTRVTLKEALENLEIDEVNPKKVSYLIFGQYIWTDRSSIEIYDLELELFYDEHCTKPVSFVTFTFPKKPIKNGASFALKVTITKTVEFLAWNMIQQPLLALEKIAQPITDHPEWKSWLENQPKQDQEVFTGTRQFYVKICGLAKEE